MISDLADVRNTVWLIAWNVDSGYATTRALRGAVQALERLEPEPGPAEDALIAAARRYARSPSDATLREVFAQCAQIRRRQS
jgi:hypothetical protein